MDWSTSALINNSPLARRLPGQRTPPDPLLEHANAADLTYDWHTDSSSSGHGSHYSDGEEGEGEGEREATGSEGITRQQEAAIALRRRRRERRAARRTASISDTESSSEGSIVSYNSARPDEKRSNGEAQGTTQDGEGASGSKTSDHIQADASAEHDSESFICRICFDGPGSQGEEGETLGKLIAPCRCRGTMKFVHQACLTRWRAASMRPSSIMACDQCGSPYKFRKSRFVGLATNRILILFVSTMLFVSLIWSVGFAAETVTRRWEDPERSIQSKSPPKTSTKGRIWQSLFGEDEDGLDRYDDDDVYAYGYGYVSTFYWEPLYYVKLIKAAVKHVGSGQATRAVKSLVQGDSSPSAPRLQQIDEKEMGWLATLVDDWKYGSGGLWEGQRPQPDTDGDRETDVRKGERYDARTATVLESGEKPVRSYGKKQQEDQMSTSSGKGGWWDRITTQFSLGFSLVGIFSFINLLLGVSLWGPFHLGNFGLGRSFARLTGGGRRRGGGGGGGGGGDGGTIASVILLFLVIIGILRALMAVHYFTTYLSKRLLTRVEDYIVEYGGEEGEQGQPEQREGGVQQRQAHQVVAPEAIRDGPRLRRRWWGGRD